MSWARTLATGSGRLRFRLQIEGFPYEPVSSKDMETTTADGRIRYVGLRSDGWKITERVDLVLGKITAEGIRVRIADVGKRWTYLFARRPANVTYLNDNATDTDATLTVLGTTGWPSSGTLYLNTETITYSGTTATTFTGCTRGVWGSYAQAHYKADGARLGYPEVADWPQVREGRRCKIYVYGEGDSPTGNGTQIWQGIISREPSYNGLEWSFTVDPITRVLAQKLGADLQEPAPIRGIYYPGSSPLYVDIAEMSSDVFGGGTIAGRITFAMAGFFEDQAAFLAALNTQLAARLAAPDSGTFTQQAVYAVEDNGSWGIQFDTAADGKWMSFAIRSATDNTDIQTRRFTNATGDVVTEIAWTVADSTRYFVPLVGGAGLGTVPRATFGFYDGYPAGPFGLDFLNDAQKVDVDTGTYPAYRLYLGGAAAVTSNTTIANVEWASTGVRASEGGQEGFEGAVSATSAGSRYLDFFRPTVFSPGTGGIAGVKWYAGTREGGPKIRQGRAYGAGNFDDFLDAITNASNVATFLNTGAWPDIRITDIDTANNEIDDAVSASPHANGRQYSVFAEVTIEDVVEQECRLAGVYPCLTSSGLITFRRLRHASPAELVDHAITATTAIVDDQWFSWEPSALGMFNTVLLRTKYDPVEDEHKGDVFVLRDVESFGKAPHARTLEIAPLSRDAHGTVDLDALYPIAARILGVFGSPYSFLTVEVPLTHFDVLIGDVVSITWAKVPNSEGTLGVTEKLGLVVSREWELRDGKGRLTLMTTDLRIGGYVPSAKIESIDSGASGGTGPFTVTLASGYMPTGGTTSDFWEINDKIRLYKWDSTDTTANVLGTVTALPGSSTLTFTTNPNWTHAGATWAIDAQISTSITSSSQKVDTFIGDSDGLLDFSGDTDNPPFVLAP